METLALFLQLAWTFFVIGAFTIGGGYAMLSLIQNQVVVEHPWISESTFTDIVALAPDRQILTRKLLSSHPERYADAAIHGIRELLGVASGEPIPSGRISSVKMGTTVAPTRCSSGRGKRPRWSSRRGFAIC